MKGTAIVGKENNQGFLSHTFPFQVCNQITKRFVHTFNQGGKGKGMPFELWIIILETSVYLIRGMYRIVRHVRIERFLLFACLRNCLLHLKSDCLAQESILWVISFQTG